VEKEKKEEVQRQLKENQKRAFKESPRPRPSGFYALWHHRTITSRCIIGGRIAAAGGDHDRQPHSSKQEQQLIHKLQRASSSSLRPKSVVADSSHTDSKPCKGGGRVSRICTGTAASLLHIETPESLSFVFVLSERGTD